MTKIKGQENHRYSDFLVDKWGREYSANMDKLTGDPIDFKPYNWTAPIKPDWAQRLFLPPIDDQDIVRMVPQKERNRKGYQVDVDHVAWLSKIDSQHAAWRERIITVAKDGFKGTDLAQIINDPSKAPVAVLQYVGPPPFPPREIIMAMAAGNEWALGLSDKIPEKALAILENIRPMVEAARSYSRHTGAIVDPFAVDGVFVEEDDDDEPQPFVDDPFAPGGADAKYEDLEEQFDPDATGGKRVPAKRGGKRTAEV